jgi:hypothetical protein
MKHYWFHKKGKRRLPITWEGWALFAFVLGMIINAPHIVDSNPIVAGIIAAVLAAIGYWLMSLKTAPGEVVIDVPKSGKWPPILLGCIIGMAASLAIFIAILSAETWYNHKYFGSVQPTPNSSWITFHSVKDGFEIQLPSYPTYQQSTVPNTDSLTAGTYEAKQGINGSVLVLISSQATTSTSTTAVLEAMYNGFQTSLQTQGATIESSTSTLTTYMSSPAIKFSASAVKNNYPNNFEGIYTLTNNRIVGIMYVNDKTNFSESDFQKLVNSFHFDSATSTAQ